MAFVAIVVTMASLIAPEGTAFAEDRMAAGPGDAGRSFASIVGEGPLSAAARREGARLAQSPAPVTRQRNWIARHPVIVGTLIGTGVGVGLSRTDAMGGRNHDLKVALLGTGGGAFAGLVASVVQKRRANEEVGAGASYCGGN